MKTGSLAKRFKASTIDYCLVGLLFALASLYGNKVGRFGLPLATIVGMVCMYAYTIYFTATRGQTIGMARYGLRMVRLDGGRISRGQALLGCVDGWLLLCLVTVIDGVVFAVRVPNFTAFAALPILEQGPLHEQYSLLPSTFMLWLNVAITVIELGVLANAKRRAVHDFVAGTRIIDEGTASPVDSSEPGRGYGWLVVVAVVHLVVAAMCLVIVASSFFGAGPNVEGEWAFRAIALVVGGCFAAGAIFLLRRRQLGWRLSLASNLVLILVLVGAAMRPGAGGALWGLPTFCAALFVLLALGQPALRRRS